jgi:hypothetical protein
LTIPSIASFIETEECNVDDCFKVAMKRDKFSGNGAVLGLTRKLIEGRDV